MKTKFFVYDLTWKEGVSLPDEIEIYISDDVVHSDPDEYSGADFDEWEKAFDHAVMEAIFQETGHRPADADFSYEEAED